MSYVFNFASIHQASFDEQALQDNAKTDPVGLLKKCRKRRGDIQSGTRRLNWQHWTACYAGALGIFRQPELFAVLLQDDYFKLRKYSADIEDLLRLALLIGTNAETTGLTYKKACGIARHLQPFFDREVEPIDLLRLIEAAGGLKRLNIPDDVVTEQQPYEANQDDGDIEEDIGSGDDGEEEDGIEENIEADDDEYGCEEDDGADNERTGDEEKPATSLLIARPPARLRINCRRTTSRSPTARKGRTTAMQASSSLDRVSGGARENTIILEVEVTLEMLDQVLNASFSYLHVRRAARVDGWQRIVCVNVASSD